LNKKGLSKVVMVAIIAAILPISAIAVYLGTSGSSEQETTGTTESGGQTAATEKEQTEGGAPTQEQPETPTTETGTNVATAESLEFKVSLRYADGETEDSKWMIKKLKNSTMMRIEMTSDGDEMICIINGAQQKVWFYSDGEWTDFSPMYQTYWDTWNSVMEGYRNSLVDWTGIGDWTYTTPDGDSVRLYDIKVNPTLPDSLFQP